MSRTTNSRPNGLSGNPRCSTGWVLKRQQSRSATTRRLFKSSSSIAAHAPRPRRAPDRQGRGGNSRLPRVGGRRYSEFRRTFPILFLHGLATLEGKMRCFITLQVSMQILHIGFRCRRTKAHDNTWSRTPLWPLRNFASFHAGSFLEISKAQPRGANFVPHLVPVDGGLAPWCDYVDLAERGLPHVRSSGTQQTHAPILRLKLKLLLSVCARRPRGKRRRRHPPWTTSFEKALITCLSPPNLAAA